MDGSVEEKAGTIGRRDVIKRGAFVVGAATLWSTPVVQTLGMRPAAAGTHEGADFCPGGNGNGTITSLTFRYTGKGCGNLLPPDAQGRQGDRCLGAAGELPDTVWLEVNVGNCRPGPSGTRTFAGKVTKFVDVIDSGIPQSPQACTVIEVYELNATGTGRASDTYLVSEQIHTSCSQELNLGEQYGPIELYSGTWSP
jgi:hypothetical protein